MIKYIFSIKDSIFGKILISRVEDSVHYLSINSSLDFMDAELHSLFKEYIVHDDKDLFNNNVIDRINNYDNLHDIPIYWGEVNTYFQRRVWEGIRNIPLGETRTYSQLASNIGNPNAVRAVGSACGKNPIAILIPCHRVIPKSGGIGNYKWGADLKCKLLKMESK